MHRDLPIDLQARHLFATGLVDDVLISNCFPSDQELEALSQIYPNVLGIKVECEKDLEEVEKKILFEHIHEVRVDRNPYAARSTSPRRTFKNASIPPKNTKDFKRGDVVIVNELYDRYKGELHIVLQDMLNDGRKNVVGHIQEEEQILLDYLDAWRTFKLIY